MAEKTGPVGKSGFAPLAAGTLPRNIAAKPDGRAHGGYLRSRVQKRSIVVGRHKTSVSLEDVFWNELRSIAERLGMHLSQLVARIDLERQHGNLSSAIRLYVFEQRCKPEQDGGLAKESNNEPQPPRRHD